MMLIKDVRGMDCRTAKVNIDLYIDGVLGSAQTQELNAHAANCLSCKKDIENAIRLKKALAALGELQPPEGLAREAARRARKNRTFPFAYISVAAAAVIALAVMLTSGVLPNAGGGATRGAQENMLMTAPEDGVQADEFLAMEIAPQEEAAEAPAAEVPEQEMPAAPEYFAMQSDEMKPKAAGEPGSVMPACIVYVPEDRMADIRAALERMSAEYGFEYAAAYDELTESFSFVITKDIIKELSQLTEGLLLEGTILEGETIQFIFNNQ